MAARSAALILLALLTAVAPAAAAPPGVLDLIPEDAAGAFFIRDLADLKKKGDKFIADADWKVPLRPSQLFEMAYGWLGITGGVDEKAPAGLVVVSPDKAGVKGFGPGFGQCIVLVIPFTDRDKMGANFGLKPGALKPDTMVEGKGKGIGRYFYARGSHVFFGDNKKAVAAVARGKPLGKALRAEERRAPADADILLHVSPKNLGEDWKRLLADLSRGVTSKDEESKKLAAELNEALESVRHCQLAVRVDGGLGFSFLARFPDKDGPARKFLAALGAGPGSSGLKALPEGHVVAAQALRGNSSRGNLLSKLIVNALMENLADTKWLVSAADRPNFVGVFAEVWKRLDGGRAAVYLNADEARQGLFSVVAIADTAGGDKFLAEMARLVRLAGPDLDLSDKPAAKDNVAEVQRLIRDLGSDEFEARESATTKLCLIGAPALPYVEKALKSRDAEVRRRAQDVKERIVVTAEARRKELLSEDTIRAIKPTFLYRRRAETLDGWRVDVVRVKLSGKDARAIAPLQQLFGPDWDKIRLAFHGKQVVALLGSDKALLSAALKNLKENKPGLAGAKELAPFARHGGARRKAEFHVSAATVVGLLTAEDLKRPAARAGRALTSVGLTVERDRLQLDLWLPSSEFKVIGKKLGGW